MIMMSIYALFDPREPDQVRYVGMTGCTLSERLRRHLLEARLGLKCHRFHWIRTIVAEGTQPQIRLIERIPKAEWRDVERRWIRHFRELGHPLTNTAAGGDGLDSDAWRKLCADPEFRARRAASLRAYLATPAGREQRSRTAILVNADPVVRAKLAKAQARLSARADIRAQRSMATTASWQDPSVRARRATAIRMHATSPEGRAARAAIASASWKGNDARKAALSERMKARWARRRAMESVEPRQREMLA